MRKQLFLLILSFFVCIMPIEGRGFSIKNITPGNSWIVATVAVSAAAGISYGAITVWRWLAVPSNKEAITKAHEMLTQVEHEYAHMGEMFIAHASADGSLAPADYCSSLLDALHEKYFQKNVAPVINQLNECIEKITEMEKDLTGRIQSLEQTFIKTAKKMATLKEMQGIYQLLKEKNAILKKMHAYLAFHEPYFNSVNIYSQMIAAYNEPLRLLPLYQDSTIFQGDLAHTIMIQIGAHEKYPVFAYYHRLENDINALVASFKNAHIIYQPLNGYIQELSGQMKSLALWIRSTDAYALQEHARKLDLLQQKYERLQTELQNLLQEQQAHQVATALAKEQMNALIQSNEEEMRQLKLEIQVLSHQQSVYIAINL